MHRLDAVYCYTYRTFRGLSVRLLGTPVSPAKRMNRSRWLCGEQTRVSSVSHVLDGIGATWRIRLNDTCAAAMRPYANHFDHSSVLVRFASLNQQFGIRYSYHPLTLSVQA